MGRRPYRMTRRHESADRTRRRIVEATYALHARRGIAATTMRDIAERAEVAVGTVYHHFPTYEDVVRACGEHTVALTRPPGVGSIDRAAAPAARLRALVEAWFGFYARFPGYERVRADRGSFRGVDRFMGENDKARRAMLAASVAPRKPARKAAAVALALLDAGVYRALLASGLSHGEAVDEVAAAIGHRLAGS
mgnify:CR=1 FL=1